MNPHQGRSAPKKKKKAARKDKKIPLGSCIVTLPYFDKIVFETVQLIEEEVFAVFGRLFNKYSFTALGYNQVGAWMDRTIRKQSTMCVFNGNPLNGIPWSVCVCPVYVGMTDYEGFALIYVAILDHVIGRPVGKIVSGLQSFLKWHMRVTLNSSSIMHEELMLDALFGRLDIKEERRREEAKNIYEGECWICLESFNTEEVYIQWNSDYFCCGHILCPKCTPVASSLKHCGVCRAIPPPNNGLEERIMSRVKANV